MFLDVVDLLVEFFKRVTRAYLLNLPRAVAVGVTIDGEQICRLSLDLIEEL